MCVFCDFKMLESTGFRYRKRGIERSQVWLPGCCGTSSVKWLEYQILDILQILMNVLGRAWKLGCLWFWPGTTLSEVDRGDSGSERRISCPRARAESAGCWVKASCAEGRDAYVQYLEPVPMSTWWSGGAGEAGGAKDLEWARKRSAWQEDPSQFKRETAWVSLSQYTLAHNVTSSPSIEGLSFPICK